jgi:hypothetical protein
MKQLTVFTYKIRHKAKLKELREAFFKKLKTFGCHKDYLDHVQKPEMSDISCSERYSIYFLSEENFSTTFIADDCDMDHDLISFPNED